MDAEDVSFSLALVGFSVAQARTGPALGKRCTSRLIIKEIKRKVKDLKFQI